MKNSILSFIFILILASCQNAGEGQYKSEAATESYAMANDYAEEATLTKQQMPPAPPKEENIEVSEDKIMVEKKIIKDGTMSIEVLDLAKSKLYIDSVLSVNKGYYANEDLQNNDYRSTFSLTLRIPAINFEKVVAAIENGTGDVKTKNINARDVTEEFYDLKTRLDNKRAYLQRYKELLKKANTIRDILEIEEKIRGIEEEIESAEGRLKLISDLVSFSTLNLTVVKENDYKYEPQKRKGFFEKLKQSMSAGWFGLLDFIVAILGAWPFWLILAGLIWLVRKYLQKRKVNKQNS